MTNHLGRSARPFLRHRLLLVALAALSTHLQAADLLVATPEEYAQAAKAAKPGDTIVLKDGEWRDFDLLLRGRGQIGKPIRLTSQTPGKVVLTGQSRLRLAGRHLEVSNLIFRDGHAPGGEVVAFRRSSTDWAEDSRVTGIVIDGYSKPDRSQSDHWVALYGRNNRFDHSQLSGKTNLGSTLVVVRNETSGLESHHRIDHNWFGPRPNLGSNGGETIRIGTSRDSLSDSRTLVENNWFEHCDGEVEIVSSKSGGNIYRGNVFFESRGSLVLRHGNGNLVERNVFIGNGKPHTGGVRVINRDQVVRDNYFQGLAGDGFAAALTVMAGTRNAPLNRYGQVENAVIERNSFIDVRSVFLGAGTDEERNAAPVGSTIASNLFIGTGKRELLRTLGDLSGIAFRDNVQSPRASGGFPGGVQGREVTLQRAANGLQHPLELEGVGAPRDLQFIARRAVGVDWYPKNAERVALDGGRTLEVAPGEDSLGTALAASGPGDRLQLGAGRYVVTRTLEVAHPVSVVGPTRGTARIAFSRPVLFDLQRGGSLRLARLDIDGALAPDQAGNAVVRIAPGSQAANYELRIEDSRIHGLSVNAGFDLINAGKGSMADLIALHRVEVADVSGAVLSAAAETDDLGTYNAEHVEIGGSRFRRVAGPVVDLYRGGTDESTFGPELIVRDSVFEDAGRGDAALRLRGVQRAVLDGNRFRRSGDVRFSHRVGDPSLLASRNQFAAGGRILADIPVEAIQ
ncbi:polysaccharide lyase 6 family protein [Luteimonas sp. 3794]|uniref:polysaccharide lyase 6 family protein n=1 Tax=Luteimonas sp. 3794 TaxID=2817730 RepID=UPI00285D1943|nr:polysaccharide lyase 6 family protein [Luteimonas sp. 3794]MDR6991986.1 poly(beta-D-mannuronate) lyase [Luteimonas sp. 3794]